MPAVDQDDYLRARSEVEVDALVDTYGELALAQFARRFARLDPARQQALRQHVRED